MKRKVLTGEIRVLESRLDAHQRALARWRVDVRARLRAVPPAWWLGGGVLLGLLAGWRGGRESLTWLRAGYRLLSLVRLGLAAGAGEL